MRPVKILAAAAAVAAMAVTGALPANAEYPEKPITLILPLGAGGSHDLNARIFTSVLPEYLNQAVIVKLMPGASGRIGTDAAAKARPDGYTLLFTHNYFDQLQPAVVKLPYEPTKDFVTVARLNYAVLSVVTKADKPWASLNDMVAWGKANPGKLRFGHSGQWGAIHVPGIMLLQSAGIDAVSTPYKGGGPAVQGVVAGDVDFSMMFPSVIESQAGNLRVLASAGPKELYPGVPTLESLGYTGEIGYMQRIIMAPRGVPEDRLKVLRDALAKMQSDKTYISLMQKIGETTDTYMDGVEYEKLRPQQRKDFEKLVEKLKG